MNLPFIFSNLGHLRKVTIRITIIYYFDRICSYPDQYPPPNAEYLVDHTLFDLKNGREYSIIMARYESGGVTMIRIAIVDDEPVAIKTITVTFQQIQNDLNVTFQIDTFTSGKELLDALHVTAYDALFLDIDMPQDSGFAVSAFLRENSNNIPIVYITNRDDLMPY